MIHYRLSNEKSLERVAECQLKNHIGEFHLVSYRDRIDNQVHFALVKGNIKSSEPTLVRVHMPHYLNDVLGIQRKDTGWPLEDVMHRIEEAGTGVIVLLSYPGEKDDIVRQVESYQLEDKGETPPRREAVTDLRTYGTGAQILLNLGVRKMRVMSAPKRIHGLSGFGLEVVEYVASDARKPD